MWNSLNTENQSSSIFFQSQKFFFKLKYSPHINGETNTSRKNTVFEQQICEYPKFYNILAKNKDVEKCRIYWQFSLLSSFRTLILFYFFLLLYVYKRELHPRNYMNILTYAEGFNCIPQNLKLIPIFVTFLISTKFYKWKKCTL
jgi:hypothetical protein